MKRLVIGFGIILMSISSFATEGMWIPALLKAVEGDMQSMGLRLSAEDIYSINKSSLKDAVVHFGGGCTAEVISNEGLILTNHHCGYGQIQSHSAEGKNYLKDGFWAMSRAQELRNPGLTATFIVRLEDVTSKVNDGTEDLNGIDLARKQYHNIEALEQEAVKGTKYKATIKPFYYGNEYYMIVTKTFDDVRLVGAPPSAIGKFGGDTDNWIWPRHTGDFSLFRIYANKNNEPSAISDDNIAYKPVHSFPVSIAGLKEGDFTMIYGFPGRTEQYLTSNALDYVISKSNPTKIKMREASLSIIDVAMKSTEKLYIQYAAKQSRISNSYKKWIGQQIGLKENSALAKKIEFEAEFQEKVNNDPEYKDLLGIFDTLYTVKNEFAFAREMWIELYYYGPEVLRYAAGFNAFEDYDALMESDEFEQTKEAKLNGTAGYFKNYDLETDKKIFVKLLKLYRDLLPDKFEAEFPLLIGKYKGDYSDYADYVYSKSMFVDKEKTQNFIKTYGKSSGKKLLKDPGYLAGIAVLNSYKEKCYAQFGQLNLAEEELMKKYLAARMKYFPERKYAADANSTLRLTYGKIEGSAPRDGMRYTPFSTIDGIIQKNNLGKDDFEVPARLRELHAKKDYGQYGENGTLNVCFTGSNHTTGGNSGSPVLDANGYLIGLNFDRTWESTMSDYNFDTTRCRNIAVDIRYVLWVIDKYAGAGHLVKEMNLITTRLTDEEIEQKAVKQIIKQLTAQIRDLPQSNILFLERGQQYASLGMKQEALNDYRIAANLPSTDIEVLNLNSILLLEAGDAKGAFALIEKSQKINDNTNVEAAVTKARIREAMGQSSLARKGYERAMKIGEHRYVDAYFYQGQFERKQGNIKESNRLLGLAAKLGGGSYIDYYRKVVQGKE